VTGPDGSGLVLPWRSEEAPLNQRTFRERQALFSIFDILRLHSAESTLKDGVRSKVNMARYSAATSSITRGNSFHATIHKPQPKAAAGDVLRLMACGDSISARAKGRRRVFLALHRQSIQGRTYSATILRIDGDTGALTGTYADGKFVLSHFLRRPVLARLEVTQAADGHA